MKKRSIFIIVFFLLLPSTSIARDYWVINGGTANLTMKIGDVFKDNTYSHLIISYAASSGCTPEIGLLFTEGHKLGYPLDRKKTLENMVVYVGGNTYSENTVMTKYSNGFETTFFASKNLINDLLRSDDVMLSPTKNNHLIKFPLDGIHRVINSTKAACR